MAKAKAFAADPRLKEVMDKNGVISKPDINYWHGAPLQPGCKGEDLGGLSHAPREGRTRRLVEGVWTPKAQLTGEAEGLYDVVLARGVDDPNMVVQIVFDIKDAWPWRKRASVLTRRRH